MNKIIVVLIIVFLIYYPYFVPRCNLCNKIKLRSSFLIIKQKSLHITRKGEITICKQCCKKHNLNNYSDYAQLKRIRELIQLKTKNNM